MVLNFGLLFPFPAPPGANKIWLVSFIFQFHSFRIPAPPINSSVVENVFQTEDKVARPGPNHGAAELAEQGDEP